MHYVIWTETVLQLSDLTIAAAEPATDQTAAVIRVEAAMSQCVYANHGKPAADVFTFKKKYC